MRLASQGVGYVTIVVVDEIRVAGFAVPAELGRAIASGRWATTAKVNERLGILLPVADPAPWS